MASDMTKDPSPPVKTEETVTGRPWLLWFWWLWACCLKLWAQCKLFFTLIALYLAMACTTYKKQEKILVVWLKKVMPSHKVDDVYHDLADGVIFCGLIEALVPGTCPRHDLLPRDQPAANLRLASRLALSYLGVTEDLTSAQGDCETRIATIKFLNGIRYAALRRQLFGGLPVTPDTVAQTLGDHEVLARGMGLQMAVVGRKARFALYMNQNIDLDLVVEVKSDRGDYCSHHITSRSPSRSRNTSNTKLKERHNIPLEYEVSKSEIRVAWIPLQQSRHNLAIIWRGQHILGSPYLVTVDESQHNSPGPRRQFLRPLGNDEQKTANPSRTSESPQLISAKGQAGALRFMSILRRRVVRRVVHVGDQEVVLKGNESIGYSSRARQAFQRMRSVSMDSTDDEHSAAKVIEDGHNGKDQFFNKNGSAAENNIGLNAEMPKNSSQEGGNEASHELNGNLNQESKHQQQRVSEERNLEGAVVKDSTTLVESDRKDIGEQIHSEKGVSGTSVSTDNQTSGELDIELRSRESESKPETGHSKSDAKPSKNKKKRKVSKGVTANTCKHFDQCCSNIINMCDFIIEHSPKKDALKTLEVANHIMNYTFSDVSESSYSLPTANSNVYIHDNDNVYINDDDLDEMVLESVVDEQGNVLSVSLGSGDQEEGEGENTTNSDTFESEEEVNAPLSDLESAGDSPHNQKSFVIPEVKVDNVSHESANIEEDNNEMQKTFDVDEVNGNMDYLQTIDEETEPSSMVEDGQWTVELEVCDELPEISDDEKCTRTMTLDAPELSCLKPEDVDVKSNEDAGLVTQEDSDNKAISGTSLLAPSDVSQELVSDFNDKELLLQKELEREDNIACLESAFNSSVTFGDNDETKIITGLEPDISLEVTNASNTDESSENTLVGVDSAVIDPRGGKEETNVNNTGESSGNSLTGGKQECTLEASAASEIAKGDEEFTEVLVQENEHYLEKYKESYDSPTLIGRFASEDSIENDFNSKKQIAPSEKANELSELYTGGPEKAPDFGVGNIPDIPCQEVKSITSELETKNKIEMYSEESASVSESSHHRETEGTGHFIRQSSLQTEKPERCPENLEYDIAKTIEPNVAFNDNKEDMLVKNLQEFNIETIHSAHKGESFEVKADEIENVFQVASDIQGESNISQTENLNSKWDTTVKLSSVIETAEVARENETGPYIRSHESSILDAPDNDFTAGSQTFKPYEGQNDKISSDINSNPNRDTAFEEINPEEITDNLKESDEAFISQIPSPASEEVAQIMESKEKEHHDTSHAFAPIKRDKSELHFIPIKKTCDDQPICSAGSNVSDCNVPEKGVKSNFSSVSRFRSLFESKSIHEISHLHREPSQQEESDYKAKQGKLVTSKITTQDSQESSFSKMKDCAQDTSAKELTSVIQTNKTVEPSVPKIISAPVISPDMSLLNQYRLDQRGIDEKSKKVESETNKSKSPSPVLQSIRSNSVSSCQYKRLSYTSYARHSVETERRVSRLRSLFESETQKSTRSFSPRTKRYIVQGDEMPDLDKKDISIRKEKVDTENETLNDNYGRNQLKLTSGAHSSDEPLCDILCQSDNTVESSENCTNMANMSSTSEDSSKPDTTSELVVDYTHVRGVCTSTEFSCQSTAVAEIDSNLTTILSHSSDVGLMTDSALVLNNVAPEETSHISETFVETQDSGRILDGTGFDHQFPADVEAAQNTAEPTHALDLHPESLQEVRKASPNMIHTSSDVSVKYTGIVKESVQDSGSAINAMDFPESGPASNPEETCGLVCPSSGKEEFGLEKKGRKLVSTLENMEKGIKEMQLCVLRLNEHYPLKSDSDGSPVSDSNQAPVHHPGGKEKEDNVTDSPHEDASSFLIKSNILSSPTVNVNEISHKVTCDDVIESETCEESRSVQDDNRSVATSEDGEIYHKLCCDSEIDVSLSNDEEKIVLDESHSGEKSEESMNMNNLIIPIHGVNNPDKLSEEEGNEGLEHEDVDAQCPAKTAVSKGMEVLSSSLILEPSLPSETTYTDNIHVAEDDRHEGTPHISLCNIENSENSYAGRFQNKELGENIPDESLETSAGEEKIVQSVISVPSNVSTLEIECPFKGTDLVTSRIETDVSSNTKISSGEASMQVDLFSLALDQANPEAAMDNSSIWSELDKIDASRSKEVTDVMEENHPEFKGFIVQEDESPDFEWQNKFQDENEVSEAHQRNNTGSYDTQKSTEDSAGYSRENSLQDEFPPSRKSPENISVSVNVEMGDHFGNLAIDSEASLLPHTSVLLENKSEDRESYEKESSICKSESEKELSDLAEPPIGEVQTQRDISDSGAMLSQIKENLPDNGQDLRDDKGTDTLGNDLHTEEVKQDETVLVMPKTHVFSQDIEEYVNCNKHDCDEVPPSSEFMNSTDEVTKQEVFTGVNIDDHDNPKLHIANKEESLEVESLMMCFNDQDVHKKEHGTEGEEIQEDFGDILRQYSDEIIDDLGGNEEALETCQSDIADLSNLIEHEQRVACSEILMPPVPHSSTCIEPETLMTGDEMSVVSDSLSKDLSGNSTVFQEERKHSEELDEQIISISAHQEENPSGVFIFSEVDELNKSKNDIHVHEHELLNRNNDGEDLSPVSSINTSAYFSLRDYDDDYASVGTSAPTSLQPDLELEDEIDAPVCLTNAQEHQNENTDMLFTNFANFLRSRSTSPMGSRLASPIGSRSVSPMGSRATSPVPVNQLPSSLSEDMSYSSSVERGSPAKASSTDSTDKSEDLSVNTLVGDFGDHKISPHPTSLALSNVCSPMDPSFDSAALLKTSPDDHDSSPASPMYEEAPEFIREETLSHLTVNSKSSDDVTPEYEDVPEFPCNIEKPVHQSSYPVLADSFSNDLDSADSKNQNETASLTNSPSDNSISHSSTNNEVLLANDAATNQEDKVAKNQGCNLEVPVALNVADSDSDSDFCFGTDDTGDFTFIPQSFIDQQLAMKKLDINEGTYPNESKEEKLDSDTPDSYHFESKEEQLIRDKDSKNSSSESLSEKGQLIDNISAVTDDLREKDSFSGNSNLKNEIENICVNEYSLAAEDNAMSNLSTSPATQEANPKLYEEKDENKIVSINVKFEDDSKSEENQNKLTTQQRDGELVEVSHEQPSSVITSKPLETHEPLTLNKDDLDKESSETDSDDDMRVGPIKGCQPLLIPMSPSPCKSPITDSDSSQSESDVTTDEDEIEVPGSKRIQKYTKPARSHRSKLHTIPELSEDEEEELVPTRPPRLRKLSLGRRRLSDGKGPESPRYAHAAPSHKGIFSSSIVKKNELDFPSRDENSHITECLTLKEISEDDVFEVGDEPLSKDPSSSSDTDEYDSNSEMKYGRCYMKGTFLHRSENDNIAGEVVHTKTEALEKEAGTTPVVYEKSDEPVESLDVVLAEKISCDDFAGEVVHTKAEALEKEGGTSQGVQEKSGAPVESLDVLAEKISCDDSCNSILVESKPAEVQEQVLVDFQGNSSDLLSGTEASQAHEKVPVLCDETKHWEMSEPPLSSNVPDFTDPLHFTDDDSTRMSSFYPPMETLVIPAQAVPVNVISSGSQEEFIAFDSEEGETSCNNDAESFVQPKYVITPLGEKSILTPHAFVPPMETLVIPNIYDSTDGIFEEKSEAHNVIEDCIDGNYIQKGNDSEEQLKSGKEKVSENLTFMEEVRGIQETTYKYGIVDETSAEETRQFSDFLENEIFKAECPNQEIILDIQIENMGKESTTKISLLEADVKGREHLNTFASVTSSAWDSSNEKSISEVKCNVSLMDQMEDFAAEECKGTCVDTEDNNDFLETTEGASVDDGGDDLNNISLSKEQLEFFQSGGLQRLTRSFGDSKPSDPELEEGDRDTEWVLQRRISSHSGEGSPVFCERFEKWTPRSYISERTPSSKPARSSGTPTNL